MGLRNPVHCVLALTVGFAGLAALYLQLGAQFVGFTQILVYVGAVAILVVFAIMMTHSAGRRRRARLLCLLDQRAASIAAAVFAVLAWAISPARPRPTQLPPQPDVTVQQIGDALMHATSCRWKSWACCSPPPSSARSSSPWTAKRRAK